MVTLVGTQNHGQRSRSAEWDTRRRSLEAVPLESGKPKDLQNDHLIKEV